LWLAQLVTAKEADALHATKARIFSFVVCRMRWARLVAMILPLTLEAHGH